MDLHRERKERRGSAHRRYHQGLPDQVEAGDIFSGFRGADEIGDHEAVGDAGDGEQGQGQRQRQALPGHRRQTGAIEFEARSAPGGARLHQHREQIGQRRRQQQQETGRAEQGNDDAEAKHTGGANQRGLHHRECPKPRAQQILGQFEQPDRDRQHHRGQRGRDIQAGQASQSVSDRRGEAADEVSRNHQAPNVGAVVPGMPAEDQVAKPADQENADDGSEPDAEQIDAVIMRRKQPREHEHAQ